MRAAVGMLKAGLSRQQSIGVEPVRKAFEERTPGLGEDIR